jgi:hypothetical protein
VGVPQEHHREVDGRLKATRPPVRVLRGKCVSRLSSWVTWLDRGSLNTNSRQHDGARLTTGIQVTVTDQELLGTIQGTTWIADLLTLFDSRLAEPPQTD